MKKSILILIIVITIILIGFIVFSDKGSSANAGWGSPGSGVAVEIAPVEQGTISSIKQFTGSLKPKTQFIISPKVSGRLESLYVNMGDRIERNQLVAVLDNQEYIQQVEQAKAELKVAEANLIESENTMNVAKRELERTEVLRKNNFVSESIYDSALANYNTSQARYQIAKAQIAQRKALLRTAEIRLSETRIHANWTNGDNPRIIGQKFADEGTILRANDPIVSVLDIDKLIAVINVTEEDYSRIKTGHSVKIFTDAHPDNAFSGEVVRMSPVLDHSSRTANIEIIVPNKDLLLKPGMFIRARIELNRSENTVIVPYPALTRRGAEQGVFLLNEDEMKVSFIPVETGIITTDQIEIIYPEIKGYVVTLGQHLINDGSLVNIQKDSADEQGSDIGVL